MNGPKVVIPLHGPHLQVKKSGVGEALKGQRYTYVITVKNIGDTPTPLAPLTEIQDKLPDEVSWTGINADPRCGRPARGVVTCTLKTPLKPGEETEIYFDVRLKKSGKVANTATVDANKNINDTDRSNNEDSYDIDVK